MSSNPVEFFIHFTPNWEDPCDEAKLIFQAVGSALSTWTMVEWQATLIHLSVTHHSGDAPLGAIASFSSVPSFDARIKMIDYAVLYTLMTKTEECRDAISRWQILSQRLRKKARKRHELAHGLAGTNNDSGKTSWIPFANYAGIIVSSARSEMQVHDDAPGMLMLTAKDIVSRDASFQKLHDDMKEYRDNCLFPLVQRLEQKRQRPEE